MNGWSRYLPFAAAGLALAFLVAKAFPPDERKDGMRLQDFAQVPVLEGGRVKPIDTVARNTLMVVSNRQTFGNLGEAQKPAIQWLLDVMTSRLGNAGAAEKHQVFRIDNDQLLNLLDLPIRPNFFRYSVDEIAPKIDKLEKEVHRAQDVDAKDRDVFDQKVLELAQHLQMYMNLASLQAPFVVPPAGPDQEWQSFFQSFRDVQRGASENPYARDLGAILLAYVQNRPDEFNKDVAAYRQKLAKALPSDIARSDFEYFFNAYEPFYQCTLLYGVVFLLSCIAWVAYTGPLNRAAFWLTVVTLAVHTLGLVGRMYIQNRPLVMVTNLYSSAVFIGWGAVILGLVLEVLFKNGIGNLLAAILGGLTLIIAHNLASGGDTLEMMRAVLDTNFWLATHVTCVTIGYAATFVAGILGLIFILRGFLTPSLDRQALATMARMIYGIVCFATFFSFTGTVLGGIWADQSWGRFWGWDPKENGALLIVIWNALILHARWAGLVKQRGMAVLAVFGNIVTAWSWFGVNMLGVGLHSYGFMAGAFVWLGAFALSQLGVMALGMVPLKYWRSFAPTAPTTWTPRATHPTKVGV